MKYGNLARKGINIEQEKQVLRDAVEKGLITEEQYKTNLNEMLKSHIAFILATNGGWTPKSKNSKLKGRASQNDLMEQKLRDIGQKLSEEENLA